MANSSILPDSNPTASGLTPQDILAFQAPLPLDDHEAREKGTNKDKSKKQYLIYINQEGVIPLLNGIDPNWTWEVVNIRYEGAYVSVTGRLTIKGVSRDGVGGNSPNGSNSPVDEDTVKGAETDALKRASLRFGIGLYLRSSPTFWIDASLPPWEGSKKALEEFAVWYKREFGKASQAQNNRSAPPQPPAPAPNASTPSQSSAAPTAATSTNGGSAKSTAPEVDWELIYTSAEEEKLVKAKPHFKNLISKMREFNELTADMTNAEILEAIRKHETNKDLAKEKAS